MRSPVLILSLFLFGCDFKNNAMYSKKLILDNAWSYHESITFTASFETLEENELLDFFLLLRKNDSYPFENLFLIVTINDAKTTFTQDTLEYLMADKNGQLLGTGYGSQKTSKLVLQQQFQSFFQGPLHVQIRHAMRHMDEENPISSLPGITSIELLIQKANQP